MSPRWPSSWYTNIAHYIGVYGPDIAIDPQPVSSSCLPPSPPCQWLVTDGAVNYSGWVGIKYEWGMSERQSLGIHTHIPTWMIVSLHSRQLYISAFLPLFHPQIAQSINSISSLLFSLLFMSADAQLCINMQHISHIKNDVDHFWKQLLCWTVIEQSCHEEWDLF